MEIPKFYDLMTPVLRVIENLGGEGSCREIACQVVELSNYSDGIVSELQNPGKGHPSRIECKVAYAGRYLCKYGVLEEVDVNVWRLTDKHIPGMVVNPEHILDEALKRYRVFKG